MTTNTKTEAAILAMAETARTAADDSKEAKKLALEVQKRLDGTSSASGTTTQPTPSVTTPTAPAATPSTNPASTSIIKVSIGKVTVKTGDAADVKVTVSEDGALNFEMTLPRGATGESAYDIAVRNGFTGDEKKWLESLKARIISPATPAENTPTAPAVTEPSTTETTSPATNAPATPAVTEHAANETTSPKVLAENKSESATGSDGQETSQTPKEVQPTTPPVALKRSISFFGDSTSARIGDQAMELGKTENIPVVNNAKGGTLAAYALMSMNGSPVDISFKVDTIPARGKDVTVDGTLSYGENVTPFSMHSTLVVIGDDIDAAINGQGTEVKVTPMSAKVNTVEIDKKYPVRLKKSGNIDGICVISTGKYDMNSANKGNYQAVLERIKTYIEKCVALVEPKTSPRYIVMTNWADNKTSWEKTTSEFRHTLKDQYNEWLEETYGDKVYDLEAYLMSEQVWTDTAITPTEADKQAQKDKILPISLSSDNGSNLLPAVEEKVAEKIIAKAKELGYL